MLRDIAVDRIIAKDGSMYFFDSVKQKWLSIEKHNIYFNINHKNVNSDRYMYVAPRLYSYQTSKKGTITKIFVQAIENIYCEFDIIEVPYIGPETTILTLPFSDTRLIINSNTDFGKNSLLKCYLRTSTKIDYPILTLQYSFLLS